ncbi:MAG: YihY/virulence factor BrkB family protein [Beijerinckiaceae bacterium]
MRRVWRVFYDAWMRFAEDDGWAIASHIALSGLTSMFPFLILVGALTGFVGSPSLAAQATRLVFDTWPTQVAGPIAEEVSNVLTRPRTGVAAIGAALALYFASSGVEAVRVGLNRAYGMRELRPWWLLRLESILYVLVAAVALIAFTFLVVLQPVVWARALAFLPHLAEVESSFTLFRLGTITLALFVTLVLGHKYLPTGRRSFGEIMPGILLTGILWLAFGEGFGFYLSRFSQNYITTYAGLASVMIALVFLYTLAAIFVFGGEFNAAILRARIAARARKAEKEKAGARTGEPASS